MDTQYCQVFKEGREGMLSIVKYLKREERGCSVLSSI